jgi:hypothetical protein
MRRIADIPDVLAWKYSQMASENKGRLLGFHDIYKGQRCVIIANGPSLARMELGSLRTEITIGMNRIYLNFPAMAFETSFYVAINELVLDQFVKEIQALQMPKFLNWNRRRKFDERKQNQYFLRTGLNVQDQFSTDLTGTISSGGTVTYVALQLAYYMGFNEVVIIGLDHRYTEKGTPNKEETRLETNDESHFHPNYFPKGSKWQLPDLYRSELAYVKARIAYESQGRRILDATLDGACPVFEKVEYAQLF